MEKTETYFLGLTNEQLQNEVPLIVQLLNENKLVKTQDLAKLLIKFPNEITPFIFEVFESAEKDISMKEWCLDFLVPQLPFFVKIALEELLQRIAHAPTIEEKSANLDDKALSVLNNFI
ncbi:DUF5071 domain-containing protein [Ureibacillus chungkukjangi]|uniref:DUF5071 domain-containing protein n=1 Tax=Ureibacillus chungkukjangi TaxID=1202712 RepID=UPI00203B8B4D|nr:DUF5071 domain-containing protein [Ureibacillus chungkukjangi]MCM3389951.1 DUF5071 domain-containing protein [Ureibacillus chungkukjangi]